MTENPCRRHQGRFSLHWEVAASSECPLELDNDTAEHLMAHPRLQSELWSQSSAEKDRQGSDRDEIDTKKSQSKSGARARWINPFRRGSRGLQGTVTVRTSAGGAVTA